MSTAIKFTPELKAKWVAALRSGKYRKTRSALHEITNKRCTYCALGLLCHVAGLKAKRSGLSDRLYGYGKMGAAFSLPDEIQLHPDAVRDIVMMNDMRNDPFRKIADFVERHVKAEA